MIMNQRQSELFIELKKCRRMSVREIAKTFFVSEMTVRRDLKLMEEAGYVKRYNGGAVICEENILPVKFRKLLHARQKSELSRKAKKYLHDSMNIYIDSSSTCLYIIPLLSEYKNIHVITNSVQTLLAASEHHITCTMVGGDYCEQEMCCVGSNAEEFLRDINVDIAFFSSLGISDDGLITDSDELQTCLRKTVIKNCNSNVFLFEDYKKHKKYLYTLCDIDNITELIML